MDVNAWLIFEWTDRVAGSFLIAAGFGMAAIRRND